MRFRTLHTCSCTVGEEFPTRGCKMQIIFALLTKLLVEQTLDDRQLSWSMGFSTVCVLVPGCMKL